MPVENQRFLPTFDSKQHPTLYHYCSISTFLSVIERKHLWLSDINTMNDYGEMHWAYDMFIEAGNNILAKIGLEFLNIVDYIIHNSQTHMLPMLCAFSTDGDMLSQWRAYADGGSGVAIGFNAQKISSLSVRIASIEYDKSEQVKYFENLLLSLHQIHEGLAESERRDFLIRECAIMAMDMAFFKNPGFAEEKEVRILRAVVVTAEKGDWKLRDDGGSGERVSRKRLPVKYRPAQNGGIISYIEMPLSGLGPSLIDRVILGPKSPNSGIEVSMALSAAGFSGVSIKKSESTYR
jgi:Protein of unknown function (DUF2971)